MSESATTAYAAPLGRAVIVMTAIGWSVLLAVAAVLFSAASQKAGTVRAVMLGAGAYVVALLAGSLLLRVRGYELTPDALIVKFGLSRKEMRLSEIQDVRSEPNALRGAIRLFANGGVWSFLGTFKSAGLGRFKAYVSDPGRTVALQSASGWIVISPDAPESFVSDLQRRTRRS